MSNHEVSQVTIAVGEQVVRGEAGTVLVACELGPSVVVAAYDGERRVAGLAHLLLPSSLMSPDRARARPTLFVDTGVPLLFERMDLAPEAARPGLRVRVVGGAWLDEDKIDIGRLNVLAVHTALARLGVAVEAEDVGGQRSRTVRLFVDSGRVSVLTAAGGAEL